jgi:hypothetical protein
MTCGSRTWINEACQSRNQRQAYEPKRVKPVAS